MSNAASRRAYEFSTFVCRLAEARAIYDKDWILNQARHGDRYSWVWYSFRSVFSKKTKLWPWTAVELGATTEIARIFCRSSTKRLKCVIEMSTCIVTKVLLPSVGRPPVIHTSVGAKCQRLEIVGIRKKGKQEKPPLAVGTQTCMGHWTVRLITLPSAVTVPVNSDGFTSNRDFGVWARIEDRFPRKRNGIFSEVGAQNSFVAVKKLELMKQWGCH